VLVDRILIKEENGSFGTLVEEITGSIGDPAKDGLASSGLEHKEGDDLLHEEPDDDGGPGDGLAVVREDVESGLEDEQSYDGDCTVCIASSLYNKFIRFFF
jgi:hypothetical protein